MVKRSKVTAVQKKYAGDGRVKKGGVECVLKGSELGGQKVKGHSYTEKMINGLVKFVSGFTATLLPCEARVSGVFLGGSAKQTSTGNTLSLLVPLPLPPKPHTHSGNTSAILLRSFLLLFLLNHSRSGNTSFFLFLFPVQHFSLPSSSSSS